MFTYIPKVGKVIVVVLTAANTWYPVLTEAQAKGIRGVKVKSRYTHGSGAPNPFDIAFSSSPDEGVSAGNGFTSYAGSGFGDAFGPVSGIYARSVIAGTIMEIITYD